MVYKYTYSRNAILIKNKIYYYINNTYKRKETFYDKSINITPTTHIYKR